MKHFLIYVGLLIISTAALAQGITLTSINYRKDMLLAEEPIITGFEKASVIVEFETLIETPAAVAYFGVPHTEGNLTTPRYRKAAKGTHVDDNKTKHRIAMDLSSLEDVHYDTGLIANNGGTIVYRIEVFDPRIQTARAYDRRLRYKREGEPKTGKYTSLVTLTEGPFIDLVTHNSAIISWETDIRTKGSVLSANREFLSLNPSVRHEVKLTKLKPNTVYTYQVNYGIYTPKYTFKTAPDIGARTSVKFGFMSDSRAGVGGGERAQNGVNAKDLARFAIELYNKKVDFVCFGGDLINGYTSDAKDYEWQLETWKRTIQPVGANIPFYESMGNHEQVGSYYKMTVPHLPKDEFYIPFTGTVGEDSAEAIFAKEFVNPTGSRYGLGIPNPETKGSKDMAGADVGPTYSENVFSFTYGRIHFISLNTNYWGTGFRNISGFGQKSQDKTAVNLALKHLGGNREGYVMRNQMEWLKNELDAAQKDISVDWIFIILHEPPFPNGGHVKDAMYWGTPGEGKLGGYNDKDVPLGDVLDMRNRFWKIVSSKSKVLAVLCGDEHNYSRTLIDSTVHSDFRFPVWQIISGGCGAPYYVQDKSVPWVDKVKAFAIDKHFCLFSVEGKHVGLEVYNDSSQLLDSIDNLTTIR